MSFFDEAERKRGSDAASTLVSPPAGDVVHVLFVCAENAARSQMAEGLLRARGGSAFVVHSAGTVPNAVHPLAVRAMDEIGIDVRDHTSKPVARFRDEPMDYVITLCETTREVSPSLRAREMVIHQPFENPAASDDGLDAFRRVRDALTRWIDRAFLLQAV